MIKTICVECGKTILWDGHGFVKYTCDECREKAGEFSKNSKEIGIGADKNADGNQRIP